MITTAFVVVACILFLIAAALSKPSVPTILGYLGLFFWSLSFVWGKF